MVTGTEEIKEWWLEKEHYPMWSTLFEARDKFMSDKLNNLSDKLYQLLGLGVMNGGEWFNNMLFMTSAGHNFYTSYWMPFYCEILGYVHLKDYFSVQELKNGT
jgi:hypothetical protein